MTKYLENCPLCQQLQKGEVITQTEDYAVLQSPLDPKIACVCALEHVGGIDLSAIDKYIQSDHFAKSNNILVDGPEWVGHWAFRIMPFTERGKSSAGRE